MTARGRWYSSVAVLAGTYVAVAAVVGIGLVDDSFIFLRYARNILEGHGAVFNAGERVEGYTSPLWLAVTTLLSLVSRDPVWALPYIGGALGFLTIILVARRGFVPALVLAAHPGFAFWSFSGMETPLVVLLLALTTLAIVGESPSPIWAGAAFAAACLTRPDCLVLAPVFLAATVLAARRSGDSRAAATFLLPMMAVMLHLVWRKWYYGDWLPNTFYAKAGVDPLTLAGSGIAYLPGMWLSWAGALIVLPWRRRGPLVVAGCAAGIWSAFVLFVGGDFFPFARFGMPVLGVLAFLATLWPGRRPVWQTSAAVAASLLLLLPSDRASAQLEVQLANAWGETGRWLDQNLAGDATVATLVAGSLPYYSRRHTIDLLGLTDYHIAHNGRVAVAAKVGHQKFDSAYVLSKRPDVIVFQESGRWPNPRFRESEWPRFKGQELEYVQAMDDLLAHSETRRQYTYRHIQLPDGTFLEGLWRAR